MNGTFKGFINCIMLVYFMRLLSIISTYYICKLDKYVIVGGRRLMEKIGQGGGEFVPVIIIVHTCMHTNAHTHMHTHTRMHTHTEL